MTEGDEKTIIKDVPGAHYIVPYVRENGDIGNKVYGLVGLTENGEKVWKWRRSYIYLPGCDDHDCEICLNDPPRPREEQIDWETTSST